MKWKKTDTQNAYNINKNVSYVPKKEDRLDVVIDILDENIEHKKMMHPYFPPQVKTADEIEIETSKTNEEFTELKAEYDRINDAVTDQKKQYKLTDLVDDIIDESNPFQNLVTEDIWIEDDIFDDKDNLDTVDTSKDILKGIKENDPFLDFNVSNEAIIDDLFESSGDDEDITTDDNEPEFMKAKPAISEDEISLPDTNVVSTNTGPKQSKKFFTTRMKAAVRAAEKVKKNIKDKEIKKQDN